MPSVVMMHEEDPRDALLRKVGELPDDIVWKNQVLCAVYERPDVKTRGGLLLPDSNREEDRFQGKVALIIKLGPDAFVDDEKWTFKHKGVVGDWIWFRTSESHAFTLNTEFASKGILCRVIDDDQIRGRLPHPDMIW